MSIQTRSRSNMSTDSRLLPLLSGPCSVRGCPRSGRVVNSLWKLLHSNFCTPAEAIKRAFDLQL